MAQLFIISDKKKTYLWNGFAKVNFEVCVLTLRIASQYWGRCVVTVTGSSMPSLCCWRPDRNREADRCLWICLSSKSSHSSLDR